MEVELGQPIAIGRTAEIYEWHKGQVLKLFHDWFELDDIQYEADIARAIHDSGLPVPAVGEVLRVNGRNGLVYQRLEGETMLQKLTHQPWNVFKYARRMAELHCEMHKNAIQAEIPSLRQKLGRKIQKAGSLPADLRDKVLNTLESMPESNRLCHGDFHPGNILMTRQGAIVIDWIDSSMGNRLADVARTTVIILGAVEANQIHGLVFKSLVRIFHATYLRHYFRSSRGGEKEYECWLPVVAAARLSENIPELQEWLTAKAGKI